MIDSTGDEWEGWIEVGRFPTLEQAYEHGLVILAMGEACRVSEAAVPGQFELHAESEPALRISEELRAYGREQSEVSPAQAVGADGQVGSAGPGWCFLWLATLGFVFYLQNQDPSLVRRAASSSTGLFGQGEWWRPFTALFLHADFSHLLGNMVAGGFFATLVSKAVHPWKAWLLILASGTLANVITSWVAYPEPFLSIGASSAVFAALGILSGLGAAEIVRERANHPWLKILAPPLGGFVLLGWLGGGGGETDVLGHVFGFSVGLAVGFVAGHLQSSRQPAATSDMATCRSQGSPME
jgi:rhomboid protease GluP